MPQGVEVQLLSRAQVVHCGKIIRSYNHYIGRLAQLVRALRLHRRCRGFESLSVHKYLKIRYNTVVFEPS